MQWWYYRGTVTTTIDLPGQIGVVIKPRQQFRAPMNAVAHLRKIKLVTPSRPPKGWVDPNVKAEAKSDVKPDVAPKSTEKTTSSNETIAADMVESEAANETAGEGAPAEAAEEDESSASGRRRGRRSKGSQ